MYSYQIALEVLNEADKNRIVALYLSMDNPNAIVSLHPQPSLRPHLADPSHQTDWQRATTAFGCASVDSMRVMTRSALKKIEKAGGKEGVDPSSSPPTKTGTKGGRAPKRKAAAADEDDEDADTETTKAAPKKRGRKPKSEVKVFEDGTGDADEEATFKASPKTPRGRAKKNAVPMEVKEEPVHDEFDGDNINVASGKESLATESPGGVANEDEDGEAQMGAERDGDVTMDGVAVQEGEDDEQDLA